MNYRHIYHAGNFADVFKHSVLVLLLARLLQKDKSFCYIDTHAGLGAYDLHSLSAQKTLEYSLGVSRIFDGVREDMPPEIAPYLTVINDLNKSVVGGVLTGSNIRFYPGSPLLARALLRAHDRMVLMELHEEDVVSLKKLFANDHQVAVHHYDGYRGLKAFLPPRERRGLVLIDPAFEQKNEFALLLAALELALSRWPTGVYAIWYPIKDFTLVNNFLRSLSEMNVQHLVGEMVIGKQTSLKEFVGCGMVIINPPWQINIGLEKVLTWLWRVLSPNLEGGIKIIK